MMDAGHWDKLAARYQEEVFSVLDHDRTGRIAGEIAQAGGPRRIASDLGCGPGKWLPLLSRHFGRVQAVDHSAELIAQAREANVGLSNIRYIVSDVSTLADRVPAAHLLLSVNALLTPSLELQRRTLDVYADHVRPGGTLLLVVPALESAHYARQMLIEWNVMEGVSPAEAVCREQPPASPGEARYARRGVLEAGGVPTKHFLREELLTLLELRAFRVREIARLEYPWATEFEQPPAWLGPPYPWDWVVIAQRRRTRSKLPVLQTPARSRVHLS